MGNERFCAWLCEEPEETREDSGDVYPRYSYSNYMQMVRTGALGVDEQPVQRKPTTLERRRKQEELAEGRLIQEQQLRRMRRGR